MDGTHTQGGGSPFPPVPARWGLGFWYGTLSALWVYFEVDAEVIAPFLKGTGFRPAVFRGRKAAVNLDPPRPTATTS